MAYSDEIREFHRYTPGVPEAPELRDIPRRYMETVAAMEQDPTKHSSGPNRHLVDLAWVICLHEGGIIPRAAATRLLAAIEAIRSGARAVTHSDSHGYAERNLIEVLDGDEDLASLVNIGRTLQEPMSRLDLRDALLDAFDQLHTLIHTVLALAGSHAGTVMPGHTHLSQAQPMTLGHYLLSVHDALARGNAQLELAYTDTNRNSGGCGATSGITWPIDRRRMSALLGFDGLVEPCYDAEASQDHSLSILGGLTNICLLISKVSMDFNLWAMEEMGMVEVDPAWHGVSSMMPNKSIPGSQLERARIESGYVIGQLATATTLVKGEPHGDMLPLLEPPKIAAHAVAHAVAAMRYLGGVLAHVEPDADRMLAYVRNGFSCATEVAAHLVAKLGYGPRRAHRIVATMVRLARERGLTAPQVTGALLAEAAEGTEEPAPELGTETLRRLLDPEHFVAAHTGCGGTAPQEVRRLLAERAAGLRELRARQRERRRRVDAALADLHRGAAELASAQVDTAPP